MIIYDECFGVIYDCNEYIYIIYYILYIYYDDSIVDNLLLLGIMIIYDYDDK